MSERTGCIYCFSTVRPKGVEHVVSKAIGVFEHNWTLDCVCDACNNHFSKTLDLTLGRDSAEGILRIMTGVKPAEKIEDFRDRSVTSTLEEPGPRLRVRPYSSSAGGVPDPGREPHSPATRL